MYLRRIKSGTWEFYEACGKKGDSPFLEWFNSLDKKHRKSAKKLLNQIARACQSLNGPRDFPYDISHPIDEGIHEFIAGDLRLLWFYGPKRRVVITGVYFIKRGQKIQKAHKKEFRQIIKIKKNLEQSFKNNAVDYFDEKGEKL